MRDDPIDAAIVVGIENAEHEMPGEPLPERYTSEIRAALTRAGYAVVPVEPAATTRKETL